MTELFVADPADAPSYEELTLDGEPPADRFERVLLGGLTQLNFEILWALAEARPWDPAVHQLRAMTEAEETWLFGFPDGFVRLLADLPEADVTRLARAWAATEEMACAPADAEAVIRPLIKLARAAQTTRRGLFLWGSL